MSESAKWYVVHTYSGYENKVANDLQTMVENRHLQDLICDIKVPVEMVPEIDKNGKQKMVDTGGLFSRFNKKFGLDK